MSAEQDFAAFMDDLDIYQVIRPIGAEGLDRRGPAGSCRLFLGPGFRLAARWNRLGETVKTRKKRGKTGNKWARYDHEGGSAHRYVPPSSLLKSL